MSNSIQPLILQKLREWTQISDQKSMMNMFQIVRVKGITMQQLGSLFMLNHHGKCGVSEMGDHLGVTNAAASQMIERIVQQGLLQRSEDPSDRRIKQLVLTEKGLQLVRESLTARTAWIDDLVANLTPEEQVVVESAVTILLNKVERPPDVPTNDEKIIDKRSQ